MAHGFADVHLIHAPSLGAERLNDDPLEVLIVYGIVAAQRRTVKVENDLFAFVVTVVEAEVTHQFGQFALELHKE